MKKVNRLFGILIFVFGVFTSSAATDSPPVFETPATLILVVGAGGEEKYAELFRSWTRSWGKAATNWQATLITIGVETIGKTNDVDLLKQTLENERTNGQKSLWIVLIGHGTFDGDQAKFNMRGPDVSAVQLAEWLRPIHRPTVVINTTSSSSPFIDELSKPGRIVITATKSGYEENFSRFGEYFANSINDSSADFDHDAQVSLFEIFLYASQKTESFYRNQNLLATEHPLLDDNGDRKGTAADWFQSPAATNSIASRLVIDGLLANQIILTPRKNVGTDMNSALDLSEKNYDRMEKTVNAVTASITSKEAKGELTVPSGKKSESVDPTSNTK